MRDRRRADRVRHQRADDAARAAARELERADQPMEHVDVLDAAVCVRKADAEQPDSRRLLIQLARKLARLVPVVHVGRDLLRDEPAQRVLQFDVFGAVIRRVRGRAMHRCLLFAFAGDGPPVRIPRRGVDRSDSRNPLKINQSIDLLDSRRYDAHIARRPPGRPTHAPYPASAPPSAPHSFAARLRTAMPVVDSRLRTAARGRSVCRLTLD